MPTVAFSGLASGIDGGAITDALAEAQEVQKIPIENQIAGLEAENAALDEINTRLLTFRSSLNDFLTLSGGAIVKDATSSDSDTLGVSASTNAPTSSTTINSISQLARAGTLSFDDRLPDPGVPLVPALGSPVDIQFTLGLGANAETFDIEVTDSTTLNDIAGAINEAAPSKLIASVVNVGTDDNPEYTLLVNGQETGLAEGNLVVSVPPEITGAGIFQTHTLEQAQDAVFEIAGLGQIIRSSNTVTGLIPGMTFELKAETVAPVVVNVANDAQATLTKVQEFIDAFNQVIVYSNENDVVEQDTNQNGDTVNLFGSLTRTRTDDDVISSIRGALATATSGVSGAVQIMPDIGIQTNPEDGTIRILKEQEFIDAVNEDPVAVNNLLQDFADRVGATGGIIDLYTRLNGAIDLAQDSNDSEIELANERLQRIDRSIESLRERMTRTFANLEAQTGALQTQGQALTNILAGLA